MSKMRLMVTIDSELHEALLRLKERDGVLIAESIRRALTRYLKEKGISVEKPRRRSR
jgi:hypothetical protein